MNASLRMGRWPAAIVLVALSALLLSGCELSNFSNNEPLCDPPTVISSCRDPNSGNSLGAPPGPTTPTASAQRFPVVALPDNRDAQIMASGREAIDPQKPVHKIAVGFNLENPNFGSGSDLAGVTAQTFVASGRSDLSGRNNALAADASGQAVAVWVANNAGVTELYANSYLSGFGARELLARPAGVLGYRVAMDGRGGVIVVWQQANGEIRSRDRIGTSPFSGEFMHPNLGAGLGDVVFRGTPAVIAWSSAGGPVFASIGLGTNWQAPVQIGVARNSAPARLAAHHLAPLVLALCQPLPSRTLNISD